MKKTRTTSTLVWAGKAHQGKLKNMGIDSCTNVPREVYDVYKASANAHSYASQRDGDQLFVYVWCLV